MGTNDLPNRKFKPLPLKVEARYYVRMLARGKGDYERDILEGLALVGLRVLSDRGDADVIVWNDGEDYPS